MVLQTHCVCSLITECGPFLLFTSHGEIFIYSAFSKSRKPVLSQYIDLKVIFEISLLEIDLISNRCNFNGQQILKSNSA